MKPLLCILCGAVLLAGLALLHADQSQPSPTSQPASPGVALNQRSVKHPLGYVTKGEVRRFQLRLQNPTRDPIDIRRIVSTCQCLVPGTSPDTIAPGQDAVLDIAFHAPKDAKHYVHDIAIRTTSKATPLVRVKISARVGLPLTTTTLPVTLPNTGRTAKTHITIHNDGPKPIRPLYATSSQTWCVAHVGKDHIPAAGDLRIPVTLDLTAIPAAIQGTIRLTLRTDHPDQPSLPATIAWKKITRSTPPEPQVSPP